MERWSINESAKIYNLPNWGADLFSINKKGNVCVHPSPTSKHSIDLRALVDDLIKRKIKPPILLRFMDVLQGRIASINRVFKNAIDENDYPATYQTFYPIKVNQQRQVVEAIAKFGKRYNIGLEVGSKPELVIGISFATGNGIPIICNATRTPSISRRSSTPPRSATTSPSWWRRCSSWRRSLPCPKRPASSPSSVSG